MAKSKRARRPKQAIKRTARAKKAIRRKGAARRKTATRRKASTRRNAKATGRIGARRRTAAPKRTARKSSRPRAQVKARSKQSPKRTAARPQVGARQPNPKPAAAKAGKRPVVARPPLDRARRTLPDSERLDSSPSTLGGDRSDSDRLASSARAGRDVMRHEFELHTESSPTLTAGDVDARWQDAYAVGDEAPGGDNPTPDQDRVDDIGKALGIQYQDDQELQGGDEVAERDKHRWELDPASSDDWPHDK
jgi:hypothetical protein